MVTPWLNMSEEKRLELVASYFHFAGTSYKSSPSQSTKPGDLFDQIERIDLGSKGDPIWIVRARANP